MKHNRRVGTFTVGLVLVAFGTLFLLHTFYPAISFEFIFTCWPVILIVLGLEILSTFFWPGEEKPKYDGAAIFLVLVMACFAMGMALIQFFMENVPMIEQALNYYIF